MSVEAPTMSAQAAKPTEGPCRERHVLSVVMENKPLSVASQNPCAVLPPNVCEYSPGSRRERTDPICDFATANGC
jgi:hypothetical protein